MSGIGNKRMAGEPGPSAPPEKKAGVEDSGTTVETIKLGGVSSTEELDIRALQTKNRKLAEMLDQRQAIEDELREHIEKLERRQATDDASLLIINRYWNQFDENIRIILKRFDLDQGLGDLLSERKALVVPEPEPDSDSNQERKDERERGEGLEPAFSFLATLASSTSEEIESQLQERVESSRRAVAQIVTMYDKLQEKVDVLSHKLNSGDISLMEEAVVELNTYLSHENGRLQELADVLQEKHRVMSQEFSKLQERVETAESRVSVLETMIDDLQWDIDKIRKREQRLNRHLADVLERVNSKGYKVYGAGSSLYGGTITINARKFEEMNAELEENKELAGNRLNELEELRQDLEEVTTQNEKLKVELRRAVEEAVKETPEYRCMQSQFSVLYNESLQLKAHLDEARTLLHGTRATHQRQVELIERDEVSLHKKLRTEVIQLEDTLAQVRKEYEMLRIEFEQTLAANEQAGPINREMRHLISSLQNHNHQLKGEVLRYKRKLREAQSDLSKIRSRSGSALLQSQSSTEDTKEELAEIKQEPDDPSAQVTVPKAPSEDVNEMKARRDEEERERERREREREREKEKEKEREREKEKEKEKEREREKQKQKESEKERESKEKEKGKHEDGRKKEAEVIKQLKAELKKAQESQKEMKLLLDMYRSAPKEQRDKVQLMAAEKKAKAELEELRQRVKELEDKEKKESKKMADEDALRKIRAVEEQIEYLQKKLAMAKQERPNVYHAVVVIFLEFFAWGLLTTPMLTVLHETFPHHTFLMNGLIQGVKGFLSFLSAPVIGALSDAWGRKYFLLLTVFFTCVPIPLMQISSWWYFAMISVCGIFSVTFSVIFAYVADVTQEHERTAAYGVVSATFAASLVISPAIGAYLSASYGDSLVVLVATLVAVVDICFILLAVPESLPEKIRPASWGSSISWEQADPFASLKKVRKDPTVLPICITVFLSYLPEAGQYSSFFLYLRQIIGFGSASIVAFIAVVGILSIIAQTLFLSILMRSIGNKNTVLLGLGFQIFQLAWYGFGSQSWMMWAAGAVAAMSSITFPAISALVSRNAEADQQGVVQGIITGVRGLCNGLGPALYGFIFFLFHVELNELLPDNTSEIKTKQNPSDKRAMIPGPPFLVGACIVLLAFLVALFIPENSKASSTKKHSNSISSSLSNNIDQSNEEDIEPLLQDSSV